MTIPKKSLAAATLLLATGAALAADPQVYRLSPDEIARAQADGVTHRDVFDPAQWPVPAPDRKIHGEVGAYAGSDGSRGTFGTAVVPLGDHGTAILSYENGRSGDNDRYYRGYRPY